MKMNDGRETILAVFREPEGLVRAARSLVEHGHEGFEAMSPVPVPELDDVLPRPPSSVRWFTLLGCIAGGISGLAFQVATVIMWPIWVGGKPILSWPAFVIVSFEMTILFGAIATFAGLMMNARLPMIGRDYYHEGCSQGDFALVISPDPNDFASIRALLLEAGSQDVREIEPASVLMGAD
jgi:hypothetical protein